MRRCLLATFLVFAMGCGSTTTATDPGADDLAAGDIPGEASLELPPEVAPDAVGDPTPELIAEIPAELPPADLGPDLPPYAEPAARVLYDFTADPVDLPYPTNYYVDPTDRHLRMGEGAYSSALLPLMYTQPAMQQQMAEVHGFSPYAPMAFLASVAIDPASLPADMAASLADGASMRVYRVEAGKPATRVGILTRYRFWETDNGNHYLVSAIPAIAFDPGTTYLLVVTDALKDATGAALGMAEGFAQVMGKAAVDGADADRAARTLAEHDRIAPLVAALPDADHVIAAVDFTIGHEGDDTQDIFNHFLKGSDLQIPWTVANDVDGKPKVTPGPDFSDCAMPADQMAYGIAGTFQPWNLTDLKGNGHFQKKAGGGWQEYPQDPIDFWLMVPAGAGPFPVVIAGHGIESEPSQLCDLGRQLVQAGVAVVRFPFPRHGKRGGGGFDFLSVGDPLRVRDNFRQSSMDIASVSLMLESLAKSLDRLPLGAPDGQPDLDVDRMGFVGFSLGAIIGYLTFPLSDRIKVMAGVEGGVGIYHLAETYIADKVGGFYEGVGLTNMAEHLLWASDGVTFARNVLQSPLSSAMVGKRLLALELIGDTTVSNISTEVLARNVGLTQVEPVKVAIDGATHAPAAGLTSGLFQYQDDAVVHGDFPGSDKATSVAMRAQVVHYLQKFFQTGEAEILLPE